MFPLELTDVRELMCDSNRKLLPWMYDSGRSRRSRSTGVTATVVVVATAVIFTGSITVSLECFIPDHLAELLLIALVQDGRWRS